MHNNIPKLIVVNRTWEIPLEEILGEWDKEEIEVIANKNDPILSEELKYYLKDICDMDSPLTEDIHFE